MANTNEASTEAEQELERYLIEMFLAVRERGDAKSRADLFEWLAADPARERVYERVLGAWRSAGELDDAQIASLRAAGKRPVRRRLAWAAAAMAASLLLAAIGFDFLRAPPIYHANYRTIVGEQLRIDLPDGSEALVNTDSRLVLHFDRDRRTARLLDGQALFTVAHDPQRPFIVETEHASITAVGTAFDVYKRADRVTVSVVEGKVQVEASPRGSRPAEATDDGGVTVVEKGKQATVAALDKSIRVEPADPVSATSWRYGRLDFDDTPLREAVEQMNRYSAVKLELRDDDLARLLISGTFQIRDSAFFVNALEKTLPIDARIEESGTVVLRKRTAVSAQP